MTDYPPPDAAPSLRPSVGEFPHSREAEEAVLGSVLINTAFLDHISHRIQPDDFYTLIGKVLQKVGDERFGCRRINVQINLLRGYGFSKSRPYFFCFSRGFNLEL